jgi:cell division protein FtsW
MVLGIVAAAVISRFDYHKLGKIAEVFAWVLWALLLLLLLFGDRVLGSTRWVEFPFFSFQPSEFIKPVLLVVMASFCAGYKERSATSSRKRNTNEGLPGWLREKEPVRVALLVAGAIVFIVWEPDLGSAVILSVGMTVAYILCGWSWYMPVFASICAALILAVKVSISHGYESGRVSDFFAKWLDGKTSHQILQAEYALGSGGVTGLGPGLSRQKYHYLPEAQNDFILAIIGEELGLSGTMAVIGAFILILLGGIAIAARARDRLGRALAGGATVMLVFQAVLNISAVTSLLPVTGKPLPFVTLGGSSMLSSFLLVGLILSVARFGAGAGASRAASRPAAAAADSTPRRKRSGAAAGTGAAGTTDARRRRRKSARKGAGSSARRPAASEHSGEVDDDEDDFDWGWDCRPRVPRTRRRD